MSITRKLNLGAGILAAPLMYLSGRAFQSSLLNKLVLKMDPLFLRAALHTNSFSTPRAHVGQFLTAAQLAAESNPAGAKQIKEIFALSESQFLQDIFCALSLGLPSDGYFVEVGVGDGRTISNTYMLEQHFGWRGLLVEPNRSFHASISTCRKSQLDKRAAGSNSGKILRFQEFEDFGEHSRIAGTGGHSLSGVNIIEYPVATVTLNELLETSAAPRTIDYLSLDTEGSELDILAGLDLGRYRFRVMTIEHNHDASTLKSLRSLLEPRGYRLVLPHISQVDAWFLHEEVRPNTYFHSV